MFCTFTLASPLWPWRSLMTRLLPPESESVEHTPTTGLPPDPFVTRLQARDERALGEFFERFHQQVERVLLRVIGPDPDLSDVAQDTFEQALVSLQRFQGDSAGLSAWLNRIAVNVAKNRLRHRRVRRWLRGAVPYETSEVASRVASPEVVVAMRRTYEVLERLPTDERIVFALRFIDGMQLNEIADITTTSLATVKRKLTKAKARFGRYARNDAVLSGWSTLGDNG